ncbi:MAG TPA: hypothetical protein VHF69_02995, partial [Candidatus Synoicihabitans sp.]|nr:hypothetical protein [Candidatus Synoicihabitans sp.]
MKPRRGLLIALGVVVAVLLLVLVLAFSSSVQTWAARRVLATQPDLAGEIGRVDVGLSYVRTENVVLRRPDMILTLPSLEADLSVLGAARERIEVRRLVAKGWTLDLTLGGATAHPAAVAAAPAAAFVPASSPAPAVDTNAVSLPVGDLLAALQLPVDIVAIDGVELEGQVFFLTGPNASRGRATVTITGGGLRPGQEGTFRVRSVAQLEDPAGPVSSLTLQSQLTLAMASPRRLSGATSTSTIEAAGGILAAPTQLHFDFAAGALSAGSVYSVQLRTPEKQLLRLEADPTPGTTDQLSGEWKLALTDRDVAPFALGYPLPHFNASGGGAVQLSTADGGVGLTGDISVDTSQLEVLLPELSAVGRTTSNLGFEARWVHDDVRVTRFHLQVAGERPVAEIVSRQGLELNLASREFRVADPEADLVEIKVHGVPLNWAQPFLGELTLTGGPLQGAWMAAAREGGFVLRAISPTQVGALQMTMHGETLVTALDVAMSPSFEYGPGGWQARVDRGQVQTGLQRFLSFEARAGQAAAKGAALVATARFTA